MDSKPTIKKPIPTSLWQRASDIINHVLHRGKYDYRIKHDRKSSYDYTVNCDQPSLRRAKRSILWDENWEKATSATVAILKMLKLLHPGQTIIDYGGGVGRIARALLEEDDVNIFLIDRSEQMRKLARRYLPGKFFKNKRITVWSDLEFMANYRTLAGQANLVLLIEALQHIPEHILEKLFPALLSCLSETGRIFVLGNKDLDVDREGRRHHKLISDFLRHYVDVLRQDTWLEFEEDGKKYKFSYLRYSFSCRLKS